MESPEGAEPHLALNYVTLVISAFFFYKMSKTKEQVIIDVAALLLFKYIV
jgi:hypothetical protein